MISSAKNSAIRKEKVTQKDYGGDDVGWRLQERFDKKGRGRRASDVLGVTQVKRGSLSAGVFERMPLGGALFLPW